MHMTGAWLLILCNNFCWTFSTALELGIAPSPAAHWCWWCLRALAPSHQCTDKVYARIYARALMCKSSFRSPVVMQQWNCCVDGHVCGWRRERCTPQRRILQLASDFRPRQQSVGDRRDLRHDFVREGLYWCHLWLPLLVVKFSCAWLSFC